MNKSLLGLKRGSEKLPLTHEIGPNFPSGFTCIGASKCKCTVHQNKEGKRSLKTYDETKFHCYSALAELQYKNVYRARWANYRLMLNALKKDNGSAEKLLIDSFESKRSRNIKYWRLHESGDMIVRFKNDQAYLNALNNVAKYYLDQDLIIYGYTKAAPIFEDFKLSSNLRFTYSLGGKFDHMQDIFEKKARVIYYTSEAGDDPIDHNDYHAYSDFKGTFCHLVHGSNQTPEARKAIKYRRENNQFTGYNKKTKQLQEVLK